MNTATAAKLVKVEDHEGTGVCGLCDREGLRWIAVLSDGSQVGLECAKKVMGYKPAPKTYNWVPDYTAIAEHTECGTTFILWQHKRGTRTCVTRDGNLTVIGGGVDAWKRYGWVA